MKHLKTFESINQNIQLDLEKSIHQNKIDRAKKALKDGADPNIKDKFNNYLLSIAVSNCNTDMVKELIKYGAKLNIKDKFGHTPLISAARDRFIRHTVRTGWEKDIYIENTLEELIMAGADWNIKNNDDEDFIDSLTGYYITPIKDKYPEQFEKYLRKKQIDKYNL